MKSKYETIGKLPGEIKIVSMPGERWKRIKGYEHYMVSSKGRVMRIEYEWGAKNGMLIYYSPIILQPIRTKKGGYLYVNLHSNGKIVHKYIHRLVAEAFISNPHNYPQVNHKDENPANNCVENLEWCTAAQNVNYGGRNKRNSNTLKGRKMWSEEERIKMSQNRKGKQQAGRSVMCNNLKFNSIRKCAEHFGVAPSDMRAWFCGSKPMPQKFKEMKLSYEEQLTRFIIINNTLFVNGMSEIDTIEKLAKENNNLVVLNILDLKEENGGIVDNTENFLSFKEIYDKYFSS